MFQKNHQDSSDIELLSEHRENLAKIMKSYRSYHEKGTDINANSVVDSLKNLLALHNINETTSLYNYLAEIKIKYLNEISDTPIEESIEEEVELELEQIVEEKVEHVDMDDIFKSTEQEILNAKDQKSLLMSLIADINVNSSSKTKYDDTQFERNIKEMIDETIMDKDEVFTEDNNDEEVHSRKIRSGLLLIIIFILLGVAVYLNRDTIMDLFKYLNIK